MAIHHAAKGPTSNTSAIAPIGDAGRVSGHPYPTYPSL